MLGASDVPDSPLAFMAHMGAQWTKLGFALIPLPFLRNSYTTLFKVTQSYYLNPVFLHAFISVALLGGAVLHVVAWTIMLAPKGIYGQIYENVTGVLPDQIVVTLKAWSSSDWSPPFSSPQRLGCTVPPCLL